MPVRMMYDDGKTSGEKASKTEKVTAAEQTKSLTHAGKNALRLESPVPCRSKHTAAIRIESGID